MLYFDLVEVGNKVYHYPMGVWGKVTKVMDNEFEVAFEYVLVRFDKEGRSINTGGSQVVFYEEPKITFRNPLDFAPFKVDRELRRIPLATVEDMVWAIITYQTYKEAGVVKTRYYTQSLKLADTYHMDAINDFFKTVKYETTCFAGLIPFKQNEDSLVTFVDNLNKKKISFLEFSEVYFKYYLTLVEEGYYPFPLYNGKK